MKKLLLLSALLIFACSSSDDSNDNGDDNSNQTFLEKYDGVVWANPLIADGPRPLAEARRYNNDPTNWYTDIGYSVTAIPVGQDGEVEYHIDCEDFGDYIDEYDLLNPENPNGFYFVVMINSEDVFQYNEVINEISGQPELCSINTFTVTNYGDTLEVVSQHPGCGGASTSSTTFQRASNVINDFADIQFPCP